MNSSLTDIHNRIREVCESCGRDPSDITLIGASKYQPLERIQGLIHSGLKNLGENYVQELLEKQEALKQSVPELACDVEWHFIGRLQRRKVKPLINKVAWIHSLDRLDLAQEIDRRATEGDTHCGVLIQVNLSQETTKGGIAPEDLIDFIKACQGFSRMHIRGLMTMPPYFEESEEVRPFFKQLRELRDAINKQAVYKEPLRELSMGMSHDFAVAIEEGATMIRIGTLLFGERK